MNSLPVPSHPSKLTPVDLTNLPHDGYREPQIPKGASFLFCACVLIAFDERSLPHYAINKPPPTIIRRRNPAAADTQVVFVVHPDNR